MLDQIRQAKDEIQKPKKEIKEIEKQSVDGLPGRAKEQHEKDQSDLKDAEDAYNKQFGETEKAMDQASAKAKALEKAIPPTPLSRGLKSKAEECRPAHPSSASPETGQKKFGSIPFRHPIY
jgi:predicted  nucleic acid-binding Zn-ribbon protein